MTEQVWVFTGHNSSFPAGVFSSQQLGEAWIRQHRLSGTLTASPLDIGAYDWAVKSGAFKPKGDRHKMPGFIATFSSASQPHERYQNGEPGHAAG
ncbi:hypothetical protein [Deinococcus frigens]|uniref:DUF7710 domain-containing protein n=1 Tax=Deinococcus frigens TaxID=249403 RepID=UPI000A7A4540|nr:hypothetical protein [Deinococcus frigens]